MEVLQGIPAQWYVVLSTLLFSIGAAGVLLRRNAIIILMSVEVMLNAVNLLLVAFSVLYADSSAQVFVFFVMVVAAAEAAVGLAIFVMIYRNIGSVDIDLLKKLKW